MLWKDVKYGYQVSDNGKIRSYIKSGKGAACGLRDEPKLLKTHLSKDGYVRVHLGKQDGRLVHRVVAEAFIPNPLNLPEVNHKDKNRSNNNVSNLEWVTGEQNMNHAVEVVYQVQTPTGTIDTVRGLRKYCRERGLNCSNLLRTAPHRPDKRNHHKGYKIWQS